jgi:hypothetical protein
MVCSFCYPPVIHDSPSAGFPLRKIIEPELSAALKAAGHRARFGARYLMMSAFARRQIPVKHCVPKLEFNLD